MPRSLGDAECVPPHDLTGRPIVLPSGPAAAEAHRADGRVEAGGRGGRRRGRLGGDADLALGSGHAPAAARLRGALRRHRSAARRRSTSCAGSACSPASRCSTSRARPRASTTTTCAQRDAVPRVARRPRLLPPARRSHRRGRAPGRVDEKVASLERWDADIIGPLVEALGDEPYRMLLLPDHATPCALAHPHVRSGAVPPLRLDEPAQAASTPSAASPAARRCPRHDLMARLLRCARTRWLPTGRGRAVAVSAPPVDIFAQPWSTHPGFRWCRRAPVATPIYRVLTPAPHHRRGTYARAVAERGPTGERMSPEQQTRPFGARRQGPRGAPRDRRRHGREGPHAHAQGRPHRRDPRRGQRRERQPPAAADGNGADAPKPRRRPLGARVAGRRRPMAALAAEEDALGGDADRRRGTGDAAPADPPRHRPRRRRRPHRSRPPTSRSPRSRPESTERRRRRARRLADDATSTVTVTVTTARRGRRRRPRGRAPVVRRGQPPRAPAPPWPRWAGAGRRRRVPAEFQGDPVQVEGLLDLRDEGYGFLRTTGTSRAARTSTSRRRRCGASRCARATTSTAPHARRRATRSTRRCSASTTSTA